LTPQRRQLCLGAAAMALSGRWRAAGAAAPSRGWLRQPVLPDVPLLDQDGRRVHLQQGLIDGRTVVINFMFTGCQTVCPPQTALLREAMRQLDGRGSTRDVLVLSLTVDPLADGPAQLRAFGQRYQLPVGLASGWVLLTGSPADVARLLAAFDVPTGAPGDHPSLLWLGHAPSGRWTRSSSLNPPESLVALIEDVRR
jgi:protein SCO1